MTRYLTAVSLLALLSACGDGQPFFDENGGALNIISDEDDEAGDGGDIQVGTLLPGTDNPTSSNGIVRFEERNDVNGGLVTDVSYDPATDTFTVDNLGFDGANVYQRDDLVPSLGGYRVFEADATTADFLTGDAVSQITPYRAILGTSTVDVDGNARTSFSIVRTGGYIGFGFGGFIYERNGGVTIPSTGQATFSGDYAGTRVFDGLSGLEYVTGDMALDIDFEDFNANDAIKGEITNRIIYSSNGAVIPTPDSRDLADVNWVIVEGVNTLTDNGEIISQVFTLQPASDGIGFEPYFEGSFTGLVAGDTLTAGDGGEVVGIISMIADDDIRKIRILETGGAILSR